MKTIPGVPEAINNYYSTETPINSLNSAIIKNKEQLMFLKQYIEKGKSKRIKMELLYSATKDGGDPSIFHQKCDDISPTLTVIKTNTDKIFGGYTTQSWNGNNKMKFIKKTMRHFALIYVKIKYMK